MSSHYTAILDACVLYPAPLRSFLMYLAAGDQFRARWTEDIHEEWARNLLLNRPDLDKKKLARVRELMDSHIPGALVTGYHSLIDGIIGLPDANDRHVVAAAIVAQAEAIVTFNLKDSPELLYRHTTSTQSILILLFPSWLTCISVLSWMPPGYIGLH